MRIVWLSQYRGYALKLISRYRTGSNSLYSSAKKSYIWWRPITTHIYLQEELHTFIKCSLASTVTGQEYEQVEDDLGKESSDLKCRV
jgi:Leu/Phe-tRNA-protein transferase